MAQYRNWQSNPRLQLANCNPIRDYTLQLAIRYKITSTWTLQVLIGSDFKRGLAPYLPSSPQRGPSGIEWVGCKPTFALAGVTGGVLGWAQNMITCTSLAKKVVQAP